MMFSGDEDFGDEITSGLDHQLEPLDEPRMLCETCAETFPSLGATGAARRGVCDCCDQDRSVSPHR
jgi:hypothetical protein